MFKLELKKTFLFTQLYVHVWHASLFPTICQCKTLCFGTQTESFVQVLCYNHVDHNTIYQAILTSNLERNL